MALNVMVVDDSSVQRLHAVRLCQEQGWEVIAQADDGLSGLLQLKSGLVKPDLILLDLEMPGINGVSLLKELGRLQSPATVMIVSSREHELLESVVTLGRTMGVQILGAVQKPLTAQKLQESYAASEQYLTAATKKIEKVLAIILHEAIEKNQVSFMYQPRIDVRSKMVHSVRLLPCWRGAENSSQIELLSTYDCDSPKWIKMLADQLQLSLSHLALWQMRGLRLALNFPLPACVFSKAWLADTISNSLSNLQIPPSSLILEINSWEGSSESANVLNSLSQLRLQGVGLAFADQGLGFAWLEEQGLMPFSEYHLPDGLITRALYQDVSQRLLNSYIALAHEFKLKTFAGNLRSQDDWDLLQSLDCDYASGQWLAPALSAEEVPSSLKQRAGQAHGASPNSSPAHRIS